MTYHTDNGHSCEERPVVWNIQEPSPAGRVNWWGIAALVILMLIIGMAPTWAAEGISDGVRARIERTLGNRVIGLFEPVYGTPVYREVKSGEEVIMAIDARAMEAVKNRVLVYYGTVDQPKPRGRLLELRLDASRDLQAFVPVAGLEHGVVLRRVRLPDVAEVDELGRLELQLEYRSAGDAASRYQFAHYLLSDGAAVNALALNPDPAYREVFLNVGYVGGARDDEAVAGLLDDLAVRFRFATKGYATLVVNYLGRRELPGQGQVLAGNGHDYRGWWMSLSHDLAATGLQALDPEQDLERVRLAWYDAHKLQLDADIRALYGFDNGALSQHHHLVYVEAPYWAAGGAWYAKVPLYTDFGGSAFVASSGGVAQYGFAPDRLQRLAADQEQKVALHELGHLLGLQHPDTRYLPDPQQWTLMSNHGVLEQEHSLMHQGLKDGHPGDVFYNDGDILSVLGNSVQEASLPHLAVPNVAPVGAVINDATVLLSGTKAPGSAVYINGEPLLAANAGTSWSASVPVAAGMNRWRVSEALAGVLSQPRLVFARGVLGQVLPQRPEVAIRVLARGAGRVTTVNLHSTAAAGLKSTWWWVYKVDNGSLRYMANVGVWEDQYGSADHASEYRIALQQPGEYRFCAMARDVRYPVPGEMHQSLMHCVEVVN